MIESVVSFKSVCGNDYPKLMMSEDGHIVLFLRAKDGVVVESDNYECGHYSEDWMMGQFVDFNGTVALSNGSK